MKDLGVAKKILGMEIHKDWEVGNLYLSYKKYIKKWNDLEYKGKNQWVLVAHFKLSSALSP